MSNRLDQEREKELQPQRMQFAIDSIEELGLVVVNIQKTFFQFEYKGNLITHYPYSGWHTGKGIKDGRGIENLLKQLK